MEHSRTCWRAPTDVDPRDRSIARDRPDVLGRSPHRTCRKRRRLQLAALGPPRRDRRAVPRLRHRVLRPSILRRWRGLRVPGPCAHPNVGVFFAGIYGLGSLPCGGAFSSPTLPCPSILPVHLSINIDWWSGAARHGDRDQPQPLRRASGDRRRPRSCLRVSDPVLILAVSIIAQAARPATRCQRSVPARPPSTAFSRASCSRSRCSSVSRLLPRSERSHTTPTGRSRSR